MTIIDILRELFGATDEQTTAFSEAMKKNSIFTTMHENMDVRYPKLKGEFDTVSTQYGEAQKLIGDLQKATKDQQNAQKQIGDFQQQMAQMQEKMKQTEIKAAIRIGLLKEKATDDSYLAFKLNEKLQESGETLELDGNGEIKGWKEKLDGLKTQFPTFFESSGEGRDGYEVFDVNKLRKNEGGDSTPTKESFRNMSYEKRMELMEKNPTLYRQLRGN